MACRSAILALLACLFAHPVLAQSASQKYVTAGTITVTGEEWMLYLSGGGEKVFDRASIGGDAGVVFLRRKGPTPPHDSDSWWTMLSVTGAIRPAPRAWRLQPFVSVGASLFGAEAGWHVGGGANYWWSPRIGLRMDVRAMAPYGGEGGAIVTRLGVAFR